MAESKSRFTVAKLDAGVAILLTSDHHLIEFPSLLLPSNITAGSIIDLAVAQNANEEEEERKQFEKLQNEIRQMFGEHAPSTPKLSVRNTTQTSVVLAWDLLDLATADMRSMSLYKNGSKLGKFRMLQRRRQSCLVLHLTQSIPFSLCSKHQPARKSQIRYRSRRTR
jgi:hypothetical protein